MYKNYLLFIFKLIGDWQPMTCSVVLSFFQFEVFEIFNTFFPKNKILSRRFWTVWYNLSICWFCCSHFVHLQNSEPIKWYYNPQWKHTLNMQLSNLANFLHFCLFVKYQNFFFFSTKFDEYLSLWKKSFVLNFSIWESLVCTFKGLHFIFDDLQFLFCHSSRSR